MVKLVDVGGLNELLITTISHLPDGQICIELSPSNSNFEIVGTLLTSFNSRIKSESPKIKFIDIEKLPKTIIPIKLLIFFVKILLRI